MSKVRETSGLLSIVLHLSASLQTTDGKAYHPSINWNENTDLLQEKIRLQIIPRPDCNWATHSQTGSPGEGSGSMETLAKQRSRGNDAEKVTRISNSSRKMLISKAKVMDSFHKRSFSHSLLSCSKDSLHIWPEENVKDMNIFKKSALRHLQWYCPSLLIVTNCLGYELSESRALLSVFIIPDSSFQCFVLVGT